MNTKGHPKYHKTPPTLPPNDSHIAIKIHQLTHILRQMTPDNPRLTIKWPQIALNCPPKRPPTDSRSTPEGPINDLQGTPKGPHSDVQWAPKVLRKDAQWTPEWPTTWLPIYVQRTPPDLKLVLKLHPPDPTWPSYACVSIIVMHTYAVVALGAISCATMTRHTTLIISCACAACRALVSMLLPHTLFIWRCMSSRCLHVQAF